MEMNRKLKLLLLSLLGFSAAACSGTKGVTKSESQRDTTAIEEPRIRVMYGVRSPKPLEDAERKNFVQQDADTQGADAQNADAQNAEK